MPDPTATPPGATRLSDKVFIAPQPDLAQFADLAGAGFKAVISNRPADEQPGQPSPAAEGEAAAAAGMAFHHIPVTTATITEADVRAFQKAVAATDGPVFAHCKSGLRSASLYAIGEVLDGRLSREELPARGRAWGIDLSLAARWLER